MIIPGSSLAEYLLHNYLGQLCREANIIKMHVFTNELITYKMSPTQDPCLLNPACIVRLRLGFPSQKGLCGCLYLSSPESRACNQDLGAGGIRDGEMEIGKARPPRKRGDTELGVSDH